jgi:hypothetical protein
MDGRIQMSTISFGDQIFLTEPSLVIESILKIFGHPIFIITKLGNRKHSIVNFKSPNQQINFFWSTPIFLDLIQKN